MKRLKGSVLVQVLMTAVVVAIIAAGMMNLLLMRSTSIKRDEERITATARTTGGVNAIIAHWSNVGGGSNCSGAPPGYDPTVPGTPNWCNCTYTANDGTGIVITATSGTNHCDLTVNAPPAL